MTFLIFNTKSYFFHFYPTDLVKLIVKQLSLSVSVNSGGHIPRQQLKCHLCLREYYADAHENYIGHLLGLNQETF